MGTPGHGVKMQQAENKGQMRSAVGRLKSHVRTRWNSGLNSTGTGDRDVNTEVRQERETSVSRGYTLSTRKGVNIGKTRCTRNLAQEQLQREPVTTLMLNWAHAISLEAPPASHVVLMVKNPPASAGDVRELGSILGSGRSPGGGNGNPLQCSCLENPMDRRP